MNTTTEKGDRAISPSSRPIPKVDKPRTIVRVHLERKRVHLPEESLPLVEAFDCCLPDVNCLSALYRTLKRQYGSTGRFAEYIDLDQDVVQVTVTVKDKAQVFTKHWWVNLEFKMTNFWSPSMPDLTADGIGKLTPHVFVRISETAVDRWLKHLNLVDTAESALRMLEVQDKISGSSAT